MPREPKLVDVVVIGGSYAGLSAALQLGRARRTVVVVDAGAPRNRFAATAHGFLGWDGIAPGAILEEGREGLKVYPTVVQQRGWVTGAMREADTTFEVSIQGGPTLRARRLILAGGVRDELPELPGLSERWGRSVFHCPYCHGYEVADRRLGVLGEGPNTIHLARLLPDWSDRVTLLLNGRVEPNAEELSALSARGVRLEERPVREVVGGDGAVEGVRLDGGEILPLDALFVAPRTSPVSELATTLGCEVEEGPAGAFVRSSERRETSVPGVFVAGDMARQGQNVALAVADGSLAGAMAHQSLVFGTPPD